MTDVKNTMPMLRASELAVTGMFPEKRVIKITNIAFDERKNPLISGKIGDGDFNLEMPYEEVCKLFHPKIPVVSSNKEEKEASLVQKTAREEKPKPKKELVAFSPPTDILQTERLKMTKPGEKELFSRFLGAYPDPYKGKKKLSDVERQYKLQRERDIEIAKSYILSGDRNKVEDWIIYLKNK